MSVDGTRGKNKRKVKIEVTYTTEVTDTITVEMPDGVTLEEGTDIAAAKAEDYAVRHGDDLVEWTFDGQYTWAPPAPDIVPDEAWFDIHRHGRWATNGRSAIREGRPVPQKADGLSWIVPDANGMHRETSLAAHFGAMLASPTYDMPPPDFEAPGGPRDTESERDATRRAHSAAVLDGLYVRYANTASTPVAIGYDAGGVPQAITALWRKS